MATSGAGSPCGACKFLRRKCTQDCIFAPYFCSEQGPARFAAIHKVFGASNVSKLLSHVPVADRSEAVVTIAYEAQARIKDPVYGCVSHIFALQQQVTFLQAQLMQVKAQMAQNLVNNSSNLDGNNHQWPAHISTGIPPQFFHANPPTSTNMHSISPQSSLDSNELKNKETHHIQDMIQRKEEFSSSFQTYSKKRPSQTDLSELQALAFRMMGDYIE
ncbi:hypothetical protein LIER_27811 [Lithospermum erythrorhizon]|uniref:LOB domain-containing protein n=1 Tax=Lithospermum erythrorhizon TaxID=34254 RepID=A0AAV3RGU6_LITER